MDSCRKNIHILYRWESEINSNDRDERKCPLPDRNHCGRSPTVLTKDYMYALELTEDLFARKVSKPVPDYNHTSSGAVVETIC